MPWQLQLRKKKMCEKPTPRQPKSKLKRLEAEIERLQGVEAELKRNLQFTDIGRKLTKCP